MRNRLWHRGAHALRYNALDDLVGAHALPFIAEVEELDRYAHRDRIWKPPTHAHGLDLLAEIRGEYESATPDAARIAYLKEIGRASYASPLFLGAGRALFERENRSHRERASAAAKHLADNHEIDGVAKCPVCDAQSLCLHEDHEEGQTFVYQVECLCCTFRVPNRLGNPGDHGLPFGAWFPS